MRFGMGKYVHIIHQKVEGPCYTDKIDTAGKRYNKIGIADDTDQIGGAQSGGAENILYIIP